MKAKILALFEKITVNDLSFCLLCFKTSEERKISVSRNFPSFLETLNFNINLQWTNIAAEEKTTCFICEAKLEQAMTLVKMIRNGIRMKNLLNYCQEYRKSNSLLNSCLNSSEPVEKLRNRHPMFMVAYECQNLMVDIQKETELETTEVLTIDTSGYTPQPTTEDKDDDDVVLIEDTAPSISDTQKQPNDTNKKTTRHTTTHTQTNVKQTKQTTNKPPSLKAKYPNQQIESKKQLSPTGLTRPTNLNSLLTEPRPASPVSQNPILLNTLMTPQKPLLGTNADVTAFADKMIARQRPDGNFELHKIVIGTDGVPYIPTLPAKLVNGQVVMINQVGTEPVETPPKSDSTIVVDPDMNIGVAKNDSVKKRKVEEDSGPATETRRLLKSSHTVDWEDKIPMDVITYVDATDPNRSANIMQKDESILPDITSSIHTPLPIKTDPELIDITDEVFANSDGIGFITSCYSQSNVK